MHFFIIAIKLTAHVHFDDGVFTVVSAFMQGQFHVWLIHRAALNISQLVDCLTLAFNVMGSGEHPTIAEEYSRTVARCVFFIVIEYLYLDETNEPIGNYLGILNLEI